MKKGKKSIKNCKYNVKKIAEQSAKKCKKMEKRVDSLRTGKIDEAGKIKDFGLLLL